MTRLLERTRMLALACAALASAGCPSLDALECHDAGCADAAGTGDAVSGDVGAEAAPTPGGIFCGAGSSCTARSQECCLAVDGGTSCVGTTMCGNGSDIFCDDPSQCPGGGTCWICVNSGGFQGTSCDYQGDIVNNDHCDQTTALALCHSSSQCEGGTTCKALFVQGFDAGAGASWFQACQP